jgi:hypothetical protein
MLVLLNQLPPEMKIKMTAHLSDLFATIKDKPEFLSGFINQIINFIDLAKKKFNPPSQLFFLKYTR